MLSTLLHVFCSVLLLSVVTLRCSGRGHQSSDSLLVGSFNIQIFGRSKVQQTDVLDRITKIVKRYDVILIQEIRDNTGLALPALMEKLNSDKELYKFVISERLGRSTSKEQYAFIFRSDRVYPVASHQYPDVNDVFEREPFIVRFESYISGIDDFAIIGIHTSPKTAEIEVNALVDVYEDVAKTMKIKNILIAGDFNADCSYVTKKEWRSIRLRHEKRFHWLIDDNADTTVTASDCAYDRFVAVGESFVDSISDVKIYHFDEEMGLDYQQAKKISDHYPIELRINAQGSKGKTFMVREQVTKLVFTSNHKDDSAIKSLMLVPDVKVGVTINKDNEVLLLAQIEKCDVKPLLKLLGINKDTIDDDLTTKQASCYVESYMLSPYDYQLVITL